VLVATHDVAPFASLVDAVLVVAGGRITRGSALPADAEDRRAQLEALAADPLVGAGNRQGAESPLTVGAVRDAPN
jgi:hypothetical protein